MNRSIFNEYWKDHPTKKKIEFERDGYEYVYMVLDGDESKGINVLGLDEVVVAAQFKGEELFEITHESHEAWATNFLQKIDRLINPEFYEELRKENEKNELIKAKAMLLSDRTPLNITKSMDLAKIMTDDQIELARKESIAFEPSISYFDRLRDAVFKCEI